MAINTEYQGLGNNDKGVFGHAKAAVEEAKAFKEALGSSVEDFTSSVDLRGRVRRHPIGMVCAALSVGYVLGGGLFSPFTARLLKIGIRLAVIPLVKSQLSAMAGAAAQPGEGAAGSTF
jgi:hypothetical protein